MTGSSKRKGDAAEREIAAILSDELGLNVRRKLGAGRLDDVGDLDGIPLTTAQVVNRKDVAQAVRHKPVACEQQQLNAAEPFGVTFVRLQGGEWRAVMTIGQWCAWWREAAA